MSDGGLRPIFRHHLPDLHWQSVESGMTGGGIPDSNYCGREHPGQEGWGVEGWLEYKQTKAWSVEVKPAQVGWIERRLRAGGRVYVAVRRARPSGPRTVSCDELWLLPGSTVRLLKMDGLRACLADALFVCDGGPTSWDWATVRRHLLT